METIIEEYKGNPVIKIPLGEKQDGEVYYFTFGVRKARAILEHWDEIRRFVEEKDET